MRTKQQRKFEREDLCILAYKLEASSLQCLNMGYQKKKKKVSIEVVITLLKRIFVEYKIGSVSLHAATRAALIKMLYFPKIGFVLGGISPLHH